MDKKTELVIQITGVKKRYRLGVINSRTLKGDFARFWAKITKKTEKYSKIGQKKADKNKIFYALNGVDLQVYRGEKLGIIGCNGAGKTTLLKLLTRITSPTQGEIKIKGKISSMLEVGTGFSTELTGRENIYLNGAILGMSKREITEKLESIIDFSECREYIDTPVKRYSTGMYVKLAFAVAVYLNSEIVVMDEVLAVGDIAFQQKCIDKMNQIAREQDRTILYVSHNMDTIRRLCDRCIVLDKGTKIFDGEVDKAIEFYVKLAKENQQ